MDDHLVDAAAATAAMAPARHPIDLLAAVRLKITEYIDALADYSNARTEAEWSRARGRVRETLRALHAEAA